MSNFKIFTRSWPYLVRRMIFVLLGFLVWAILILLGYMMNKAVGGDGEMVVIGVALGGAAFLFMVKFKSKVYRFAHIAVVTEAITGGGEVKGAAGRGMKLYKSTFKYVSVFALIKDIFKFKHISNVWQIATFYLMNFIPYTSSCIIAWTYVNRDKNTRDLFMEGFENFKARRRKILPKIILALIGDLAVAVIGILTLLTAYVCLRWGSETLAQDARNFALILMGIFWFLITYVVRPYRIIGVIKAFIQKENEDVR